VVHGACSLRPGVKGISDRIRVRSIVGRFLEHSRIFYFANGGESDIYLRSADWMPRNLYGEYAATQTDNCLASDSTRRTNAVSPCPCGFHQEIGTHR